MKYGMRAVFVVVAAALASALFLATADVRAEDLETPGLDAADEAVRAETPGSGATEAETTPAGAEAAGKAGKKNIRVVAPYLGTVTNVYENEERGLDLKDTRPSWKGSMSSGYAPTSTSGTSSSTSPRT